MDQFTRRLIGFGVHSRIVNGVALCRMFQHAIRGQGLPKYLSSDHDPLYRFQQWQANLRVLEVNTNQNHSVRASLASVHRTVDRHGSARLPESDSILEHGRPRGKADRFQTLL